MLILLNKMLENKAKMLVSILVLQNHSIDRKN